VEAELTGGLRGGAATAAGEEDQGGSGGTIHDLRRVSKARPHWNGYGVEPKGELTERRKSTTARSRRGGAPVKEGRPRWLGELLRGDGILPELLTRKGGRR
jgi:hypothetical protein